MTDLIQFNEIPNTRIPGTYAEFNLKAGRRLLPENTQTVVYIVQAGNAVATGELIDIYGADDAAALCGYGSLLHRMVMAGLKANRYQSIQALLLDDSTWGAAATLSLPLDDAAAATAAGYVEVRVGTGIVRVDVAKDDVGDDIKEALVAAINAQPDLPVTAALGVASPYPLTLTAKSKGFIGGQIKVSTRSTAAGITFTNSLTTLTTASTKPEASAIDAALAIIRAAGHTLIAMPYVTAETLEVLKAHIDDVSSAVEKRGCRAVVTSKTTGTIADAKTLSEENNHWRTMNLYLRGSRSWEPEVTAAAIGVVMSQTDPGLPLNRLPVLGIDAPVQTDWFERNEMEDMLRHGVSPLGVGAGNVVQFVRAITTYTTTESGIADDSLLDFTKAGTADYVRKACVERVENQFNRVKRSDRILRKQRSELLRVMIALQDLEIVEDVERYKDDLIVVRHPTDQYASQARVPVAIIPGLHVRGMVLDLL